MENTHSLSIMRDLILGKRWVLSLLIILLAFSTSVIIVCILFLKFNNSFTFFIIQGKYMWRQIPAYPIKIFSITETERETLLLSDTPMSPSSRNWINEKKRGRWWWYKLILLSYIPWYNHMLHSVCIQVLCRLCYFMLFYLCSPPSWTTLNLKQWHFLSLLIYI